MNQDKIIRDQLIELLDGRNSHMSFTEAVADFPLEAINRKAPGIPYSPWHFVEHMRIAQWDILEFIRNEDHVSPDYPEGYRPGAEEEADEEQWRESVVGFVGDQEALQDLVTDPGTDLFAPISHAPGYTIFREILVVSAHNSYHTGELALLRQILKLWPADKPYLTG